MKTRSARMVLDLKRMFLIQSEILLIIAAVLVAFSTVAQQNISSGAVINENLTGYLGTSTAPANWSLAFGTSGSSSSGGTAFNGTGQTTGSTGGFYGNNNISFLGSGSAVNGSGTWQLKNTSGAAVAGFTLQFVANMWKSGTASPLVKVYYMRSTSATFPTTTTQAAASAAGWTELTSLGFSDSTPNISTGATLSQTVSSLAVNIAVGEYLYIRWIHAGGTSADNLGWDTIAFTPTFSGPSAPAANAATSITSGGFTANWSSSSGATGYYLDVATDSGFSSFVSGYNNLDVGNVTSKAVSGLSASTTYYYRLRAYNGTGTSSSSSTISVTTVAPAVPKITLKLPGQSSANTGTPTTQNAGTAFNVAITATTDGTTTDTSYTGAHTINFTASSGSSVSPTSASVTFSGGVGTANITLTNTTATPLVATDGTIAGTASSSVSINPGAINGYTVTAPSAQARGVAFNVSVTAKDAYGNTVTTDSSTAVTMSSSSGNVQFGSNPTTLSSGTFTVGATDNTAETTTVTATDGNSKTGTSSAVTVVIPKYRSKLGGNWNATNTWEISADGGTTWTGASATPSSSDSSITIRNGHSVTNTTSVTVDEVAVASGATLVLSTAFTVNNGTGDDIDVQNGGVFLLPSSGVSPIWNAGATAKIETGGILKVTAGSLTGSGTGVNADNFIYQDGSILEIGTTPSTTGITYFPNVDNSTIPVLRLTGNPSSLGGNSSTTINGVFEAPSGASSTWQGAANVTFRNGLRGSGDVTQAKISGLFVINGTTAELGGAGKINLGDFTGSGVGLLITNGSVVSLTSSKSITLGTITNRGTLNLNGYSLTGDATFRIASKGILQGPGSVSGAVITDAGGTIIPGGTSIGTLTLAASPTFSGTNFLKIDRNGGSPLADKIVLASGTLNYGGALTVFNASLTAIAGGEVFDLFDAPAFSGAFTATNLPSLGTGLNWYLGSLTTDGTIRVNQKPVSAASKTFTNVATLTLKIPITNLIVGATDPDGDTVTLTGINLTTTNGTTLVTNSTYIFYTNAATMPDSFTYTISDGRGGTATGTVNITMLTSVTGQMSAPTVNGRSVALHFAGHPGWTYSIERSINDLASWSTIWTTNAPSGGTFDFPDDVGDPPPTSVYYRLRWTP